MPGERKAVDIVQDLIRDCSDARQSYRYAADHASHPELRAFFSEQCVERGEFGSELQHMTAQEGGQTEIGGTSSGVAQRGWVAPKHVSGDNELLEAVERREALSRKLYEQALQQGLPDKLREVVARQAEAVKAGHDHLTLMRERLSREQAA